MAKAIILGADSRDAIMRGVKLMADAVRVTLGPKGRNVVIERSFGLPIITKDGVTVAREIELKDPLENIGAQMLRQVALKTSDVAGDGTTTATVLALALYESGMKLLAGESKRNPQAIKRGMDQAVEVVVGRRATKDGGRGEFEGGLLNLLSKPVSSDPERVAQIGTISANGDTSVGKMIAEAIAKVGPDGVVSVEESGGFGDVLEVVQGMQFMRGYPSPVFRTSAEREVCELEKVRILVTDRTLSTVDEVHALIKLYQKLGPMLIIAADFSDIAAQMLVMNRVQQGVMICPVKSPGYGDKKSEVLRDIAIVTGATCLFADTGTSSLRTVGEHHLGRAERVVITPYLTTIIGGGGNEERVEERVTLIRSLLADSKMEFETRQLRERLAKMAGGVAVISAGAPTELEMKERKDRIEDAVNATRAALEEGVVAGGGAALLRCGASDDMKALFESLSGDELEGAKLVAAALSYPLLQILDNAGSSSEGVVEKILASKDDAFGLNVATGDYEDLVKAGVMDPTKVTRHALINASSIAGMMLTTEALVYEVPTQNPMGFPLGTQGMV